MDKPRISRRKLLQTSAIAATATYGLNVSSMNVHAQSSLDNEISGFVQDSTGLVENATVVAVPHNESLSPLVTTTDENGEYIFDANVLHEGENLYHIIARNGNESNPYRGEQNYPFISAEGVDAIPDSAIIRYKMDEGSGTTLSDSIGSEDASISGASWTSGTWVGDWALDGDGTDDLVDTTTWGSWGGNIGLAWTIAFTVQTTDDDSALFGHFESGSNWIFTFAVGNVTFDPGAGNIGIRLRGDGQSSTYDVRSDTAVNDGSKKRVVISNDGSDSISIYINDSADTSVVESSATISSNSNFSVNIPLFCRYEGSSGTTGNHLDGTMDDFIVANAEWTATEREGDYNRQPWS